ETRPAARPGEHAARVEAEEPASGTADGAAARDVEPAPLAGRGAARRRAHRRWTRKTPKPIRNDPIHWTALIGSLKSHFAATICTPRMLMPVVSGKARAIGM